MLAPWLDLHLEIGLSFILFCFSAMVKVTKLMFGEGWHRVVGYFKKEEEVTRLLLYIADKPNMPFLKPTKTKKAKKVKPNMPILKPMKAKKAKKVKPKKAVKAMKAKRS